MEFFVRLCTWGYCNIEANSEEWTKEEKKRRKNIIKNVAKVSPRRHKILFTFDSMKFQILVFIFENHVAVPFTWYEIQISGEWNLHFWPIAAYNWRGIDRNKNKFHFQWQHMVYANVKCEFKFNCFILLVKHVFSSIHVLNFV